MPMPAHAARMPPLTGCRLPASTSPLVHSTALPTSSGMLSWSSLPLRPPVSTAPCQTPRRCSVPPLSSRLHRHPESSSAAEHLGQAGPSSKGRISLSAARFVISTASEEFEDGDAGLLSALYDGLVHDVDLGQTPWPQLRFVAVCCCVFVKLFARGPTGCEELGGREARYGERRRHPWTRSGFRSDLLGLGLFRRRKRAWGAFELRPTSFGQCLDCRILCRDGAVLLRQRLGRHEKRQSLVGQDWSSGRHIICERSFRERVFSGTPALSRNLELRIDNRGRGASEETCRLDESRSSTAGPARVKRSSSGAK